jgi:hypothetical protein
MKGDEGAPLLEEEIPVLKNILPATGNYLTDESLLYIRANGFSMKNKMNEYFTNTINDEDCVFVFYEKGIARCSIEKAYFNGETDFRKPVSCHLFPIRVKGKKREVLKYERISECEDALYKGIEDDLTIFEFARESLIREYGKEFYNNIKNRYLKK